MMWIGIVKKQTRTMRLAELVSICTPRNARATDNCSSARSRSLDRNSTPIINDELLFNTYPY